MVFILSFSFLLLLVLRILFLLCEALCLVCSVIFDCKLIFTKSHYVGVLNTVCRNFLIDKSAFASGNTVGVLLSPTNFNVNFRVVGRGGMGIAINSNRISFGVVKMF